jgi:hypothetical protein
VPIPVLYGMASKMERLGMQTSILVSEVE